jgi:transposase-like protein
VIFLAEVPMVRRKVRDAEEAAVLLAEAEHSGMSRAEFARSNGIDARSLNMWRLCLARREPLAELRLVELVTTEPSAASAPMAVRCGPFAVEVPTDFDDHHLRRVLAAVAAC